MKKVKSYLLVLLATIIVSCTSSPTQIFVAPNGSDTKGTGSIQQPFASLERARGEIRKLKNGGEADKGFHVNLREGIYDR